MNALRFMLHRLFKHQTIHDADRISDEGVGIFRCRRCGAVYEWNGWYE